MGKRRNNARWPKEPKTAEEVESKEVEVAEETLATVEEETATEKVEVANGDSELESKQSETVEAEAAPVGEKEYLTTPSAPKTIMASNTFKAAVITAAIVLAATVGAVVGGAQAKQEQNVSTVDKNSIEYQTIAAAVEDRFAEGSQYYIEGTINNTYQTNTTVLEDGSAYVHGFLAVQEEGSEEVTPVEVLSDYVAADGNYYIAKIGEKGENTGWVNASVLSQSADYIRSMYIQKYLDNATSVRRFAQINLDENLQGVDVYEVGVSGDLFTEALNLMQNAQYTYMYEEAVKRGDSEFKDMATSARHEIHTTGQMSDGTIELGVKDGKLYYFGINTGGGGYSYIASYTIKDQIPTKPEAPDISSAVDLYEDAKSQFDASQEPMQQYMEEMAQETEEDVTE